MKKQILIYCEYISAILLLLICVFLPVIKLEGVYNSIVISKSIFLICMLLFLGGVASVQYFLKTDVKFAISRLDIALLGLLIYIIFNRYSIQDNYVFSIRFVELVSLTVLYLFLKNIRKQYFYYLLIGLLISGIVQAVYGNLQLLGVFPSNSSRFNITGSFFNPGPYSGFLSSIGVLALGVYFFKYQILEVILGDKTKNIFISILNYTAIICLLTIVLVLPATQSRASWISFLAGGLLIVRGKYSDLKIGMKYKRIFIALLITVVLPLGYFLYVFKKDSANGRLLIWKICSDMINEHFFFGVGFDRFQTFYMEAQANYFVNNYNEAAVWLADNTRYAFNGLIHFFIEQGILGGVLLSIIVVFVLKKRNKNSLSMISKIVLISLFFFGMTSYPMHILPIKIVVVVMLVWISNSGHLISIRIIKASDKSYLKRLTIIVPIVAGGIFTWMYVNKLTEYFVIWNEASKSYNYSFYKESAIEYQKASVFFKKNGDFQLQYGQALYHSGYKGEATVVIESSLKYTSSNTAHTVLGDCYRSDEKFLLAEIAYKNAYYMIPSRLYPQYLLAKLYEESKQQQKLKEIAQKIVAQKAKVNSPATNSMKKEMQEIFYNLH